MNTELVDPNANFQEFIGEPSTAAEVQSEATVIKKTEAKQPEATAVTKTKVKVEADESGALVPRDFEGMYRLSEIYAASKLLPQGLDTPAKVFTALQFAKELGLKGYVALRNIYVVNGNPSLWGDLPLAIVRNSGNLYDITEWVFDKDGNEISPENKNISVQVHGAGCKTTRLRPDGTKKEVTTWFTLDDAKVAKLFGTKVWAVYPRRMLQCRARAQNLKDNFGDALCGAAIMEYDYNNTVGESGELFVESEQQQGTAAKLNAMFLTKQEVLVEKEEG